MEIGKNHRPSAENLYAQRHSMIKDQHYQGRGRKEKLTKDLLELIKAVPEENGFRCGYG